MKAIKKLEEITFEYFGRKLTVRTYANGEHRCSCQRFLPKGGICRHVNMVKYGLPKYAKLISARRF